MSQLSSPPPPQRPFGYRAGHGPVGPRAQVPLGATLAALGVAFWSVANPPGPSAATGRVPAAVQQATLLPQPAPPIDFSRLRTPTPEVAALSDEQIAARLLGVWICSYHGTQRIENLADRTARLHIDFDWLAAFFYGSHMQLDLIWKVENGVLTNHIERGEPQAKVDRLIADYSENCSYLVLELQGDSLLLQEVDDPAAFHRWTRIAPAESGSVQLGGRPPEAPLQR